MKSKKSSTYVRELSIKQIKDLQNKYSDYLKNTRQGFLSMPTKKKLLKIKHFEKQDKSSDQSGIFYDIREHAKTAFGDFLLLFDTLSDEQIKQIFENQTLTVKQQEQFKNIKDSKELETFFAKQPTFLSMINSMFRDRGDEDSWQAMMSYYTIVICTKFLRDHGFVSTVAHNRLLDEVEDMINVEISRGIHLKRENRVKGFA